MGVFIGLDVSLNKTAVCVVDRDGVVLWQGKVPSEPGPLVNHAAATLNCAPVAQTNPRAIAALSKHVTAPGWPAQHASRLASSASRSCFLASSNSRALSGAVVAFLARARRRRACCA